MAFFGNKWIFQCCLMASFTLVIGTISILRYGERLTTQVHYQGTFKLRYVWMDCLLKVRARGKRVVASPIQGHEIWGGSFFFFKADHQAILSRASKPPGNQCYLFVDLIKLYGLNAICSGFSWLPFAINCWMHTSVHGKCVPLRAQIISQLRLLFHGQR